MDGQDGRIPGTARASPPGRAVPADAVWEMLPGAVIGAGGDGPVAVDVAVLHPGRGIALVEVSPHDTPSAEAILRRRLEAARLDALAGGLPPIVHLRLAPEAVPELVPRLEAALAAAQMPDLPEHWVSAVRAELAGGSDARASPGALPDAPVAGRGRAGGLGAAAQGSAAFVAGVALAFGLAWSTGFPLTERAPGPVAALSRPDAAPAPASPAPARGEGEGGAAGESEPPGQATPVPAAPPDLAYGAAPAWPVASPAQALSLPALAFAAPAQPPPPSPVPLAGRPVDEAPLPTLAVAATPVAEPPSPPVLVEARPVPAALPAPALPLERTRTASPPPPPRLLEAEAPPQAMAVSLALALPRLSPAAPAAPGAPPAVAPPPPPPAATEAVGEGDAAGGEPESATPAVAAAAPALAAPGGALPRSAAPEVVPAAARAPVAAGAARSPPPPPRAAAAPARATPAAHDDPRPPPADPRCASILARLQLGETPSYAERQTLQRACARRS